MDLSEMNTTTWHSMAQEKRIEVESFFQQVLDFTTLAAIQLWFPRATRVEQ